MSNEEKVRAAWKTVRICNQPDVNGRNLVFWWVLDAGEKHLSRVVHQSHDECIAGLAAYTDEVLAEAARMQAEMDLVREQLPSGVDWSRWSRILSRLQALYDAHVRGLKSEALR